MIIYPGHPFAIPQHLHEQTRDLYLSGQSLKQIADKFDVSYSAVNRLLVRLGVQIRPDSCRGYQLNHQFFDEIDTEAKAYWLGFLATDGNVTGTRIRINLALRDSQHLQKFANHLESNIPVKPFKKSAKQTGKEYDLCMLQFRSKHMSESLARYHIVPHKTFTVKPPDLRPDLMRHYWRGCVDGDGCLTDNSIQFCGNKEMVGGFDRFIKSRIASNSSMVPYKKIWTIGYGGRIMSYSVAQLLYEDSKVFLERKYNKYLNLLANRMVPTTPKKKPKELQGQR